MSELVIMDTTLRDGCQAPGFALNPAEKLSFALMLEKLGVDIIEAGFSFSSSSETEAIEMIASEVRWPSISVMARANERDIVSAARSIRNARSKIIHLSLATSPVHREFKLNKTKSELLLLAANCVQTARGYCDDVEFGAEDATRTELDFLLEFYNTVIQAGATIINVPDTVGFALPEEYGKLIGIIRDNVVIPSGKNIRISVHCHNDLGMAAANTLAGIKAGATQAEVTINGIGERAGNAALEEVVMAVITRPDIFGQLIGRIKSEEIYSISGFLSTLTGTVPQPNKAVVGLNVFSHSSGIHQHGIVHNSNSYSILDPEKVGRGANKVSLNFYSGKEGLKKAVLDLTGFELSEALVTQITPSFKHFADGKKIISGTQLLEWFSSKGMIKLKDYYHFVRYSERSRSDGECCIRIYLKKFPGGFPVLIKGKAKFMQDSVLSAFRDLLGGQVGMVEHRVTSCSNDKISNSKSYISLSYKGKIYSAEFYDRDPVVALIESMLDVVNQILQRET